MDTAAYWVALLSVVTVPPFLLFWFIVHPFTPTWRRLGAAKTYLVVFAILLPIGVVTFLLREPLLRVRFGVRWPLVVPAIVLFLASLYIGARRARHMGFRIMLGLPQLSEREYPGKLITEGIYAHIRNPRYVEAGLGVAAVALFCNYLAAYVLLAACVPVIYLWVLLEERELRERFGAQYERYCRDVPRFVPRLFARRQRRS